ncbi:MAG: hypothetical protein IPN69_23150 [Acidobacteria bacterium]|nr:hypothetical protein [Acidobacteriota bacterium]
MKRTAFLTAAIAILAALSPSFGQEREPQRGFRAGNSYSISDIENVNLNNGNLMLTIPLASLAPGRGTSPGYTVSLRYNGKLWDSRQERRTDGTYGETGDTNYMRELLQLSEQAGWKLDTGGFRLILKSRFNLEEQAQCTAGNGYEYRRNGYIFRLEMEMPDGSVKEFRPYGTGSAFDDEYDDGWFSIDPNGSRHVSSHIDYNGGGTSCSHDVVGITSSGMNYYTNDGSGLRLFVPAGQNVGAGIIGKNWTLYMPGGTTVENLPPDDPGIRQRMTDANGNRLVWKPGSYGGSNGEMIEDGAGHFVFITTDANGTQRVIQRGFGGADVETEIRWKTCWVYRNYKATSASNANGAYIYEDLFRANRGGREDHSPRTGGRPRIRLHVQRRNRSARQRELHFGLGRAQIGHASFGSAGRLLLPARRQRAGTFQLRRPQQPNHTARSRFRGGIRRRPD